MKNIVSIRPERALAEASIIFATYNSLLTLSYRTALITEYKASKKPQFFARNNQNSTEITLSRPLLEKIFTAIKEENLLWKWSKNGAGILHLMSIHPVLKTPVQACANKLFISLTAVEQV